MFRSIVLGGALLALLAGCTSSEVKIVKESRLPEYPDFLIGQAFDNRSACAPIEWKSFEDDRKRAVVEYTCQYKFAPEYYKELTSEMLATEAQSFEQSRAMLEGTLKQRREAAEGYQKKLPELQAEFISETGHTNFEVLREMQYQGRFNDLRQSMVNAESETAEVAKLEASREAKLASLAADRDEKSKKYQAQLENFKSANEKIQWVVIDGKAQRTGIYFVLRNKDGNFEKPMSPNLMLNEIYQNREGTSGIHKSFLKEIWYLQLGGQQR